MAWTVLALLSILVADAIPKADPARDQATVSFEAKAIETWPDEPISLPEAIELIAAQTGNRIEILQPQLHPDVWQAKHKTDYKGKTFWQLAPELAKTWDMRVNTNGDGCLFLNYGRDMHGGEAGSTHYYDPWNHDALIAPVQFEGAFAFTIGRSKGEISVELFPEPRLEHFQCDKAELTVVGANGASVRLPLKPALRTDLTLVFDAAKAPEKIAAVSMQCSLIYPHDWKIVNLGSLADVLKKPTKTHGVGLYKFRVVSSKYAVAVDKYTREQAERPGLVIGYHFASKILYTASDFVLARSDKQSAIEGRPFDIDKFWKQEPAIEFHYATEQKISPAEFELWVRAPHEVAKSTVKFTRKF